MTDSHYLDKALDFKVLVCNFRPAQQEMQLFPG